MSLLDALLLDPSRDPREIFVALRTDGNRGCGTRNDPYDAGTAERFDAVMRSVPENSAIRLGPGKFFTYGYSDARLPNGEADRGWAVRGGIRLMGSGTGATSLKLMEPTGPVAHAHYFAVGHALNDQATPVAIRMGIS